MTISVLAVAVAGAATPEAAFDRYRTDINSHDFERLAATVFTADVVFVFKDGVHRGQAEARAAFNAAWSSLRMRSTRWKSRNGSWSVRKLPSSPSATPIVAQPAGGAASAGVAAARICTFEPPTGGG